MDIEVRAATPDDLPAILAATTRRRAQLAGWEPGFFRPAAAADDAHAAYLTGLVERSASDPRVAVRVVTADGEVVGCLDALEHGDRWLVDDLATVEDGWWSDAMVVLVRGVAERPALLCVPRRDVRANGAADTVGLRPRSSYWVLDLTASGGVRPDGTANGVVTLPAPPDDLPAAPVHTFPDPLAAGADGGGNGVTVLGDGAGGALVLAPSTPAPPVYDPGGPTALVDRVSGDRRGDLLAAAAATAAARGDAQLLVVCGDLDGRLEDTLIDGGFHRVVDVRTWPRFGG